MSDEEIALLRAVCERPDDDLPRLIYADWLDDRGDPRGEFIRIECELAKLAADDPRRRPLHERACAIIKQHKDRWVGPIRELAQTTPRPAVRFWDFRRGLLEMLDIDADPLIGPAADYVRWMPVRQLAVRQVRNEHAAGLAQCLPLRRATALELVGGQERPPARPARMSADFWQVVLAGVGPCGPERLKLEVNLDNDGIAALAVWPGLNRVRVLWLQGNLIGDAGARALAASPMLDSVRTIDVMNNPLTWEGIVALRERFGDRLRFTDPGQHRRTRRRVRPQQQ